MCLIWTPLYIIQGLPWYPQVPVSHLHLHPLLPTHCVIRAIPNYQRTDLILISAAISQTHVKSEIIRLRGRPLIISPDGRIRLMNNYSYIKTRDLLLKMFEKKPDQLQVILNELHLAMKSKTSNLTTSFLKNYLDFNNQIAIILLWNGYIIKNGRFLSLKETHDSICNQNHDITYIHDAVSDVKLTK
ncbi:hypothetical protein AGLY_017707, partial [Aphis glycines]